MSRENRIEYMQKTITMFQHEYPLRTASGFCRNGNWIWEPVKWIHCRYCGLFHSNRHIPASFWDRTWEKKRFRHTAGVILTKKVNDIRYFWITQSYHNMYGFPKGTAEEGETAKMAAQREFFEETGYKLEIEKSPELRICFRDKTTSFFLVEVEQEFDIKVFPKTDDEITSFGWISEKNLSLLPLNRTTRDIMKLYKRFH
jgi:8-oxo-dGTP pyrophosphatase MutT (NUDIX family)